MLFSLYVIIRVMISKTWDNCIQKNFYNVYFSSKYTNRITCKISKPRERILPTPSLIKLDADVLLQLGYSSKKSLVYSDKIALNMCKFMSLSYENRDIINDAISSCTGSVVYYNPIGALLHFKQENLLVLTFAGTQVQSFNDWWVNITVQYLQEWYKIKEQIIAHMNSHTRANVVICGHSKGGALAVYAFNDLKDIFHVSGCYVAGLPDSLIRPVKYTQIYNIKDVCDPICKVFSSQEKYWEIKVGDPGPLDMNRHDIDSYINLLTLRM